MYIQKKKRNILIFFPDITDVLNKYDLWEYYAAYITGDILPRIHVVVGKQ